ncbi:Trafficking protein particle complex subunit 10 [Blomia tropicalis]|nr:Trafficking protein particle complex subunit 10 [Blomia tropicalis]
MAYKETQLSLLAQFDDFCRISKSLFEQDVDDFSNFVHQTECNRLNWLKTKHDLADANKTIEQLRSQNNELEENLKRIRKAFGMEIHKNDENEKERARLRKVVSLIRECITDENKFNKEHSNGIFSKRNLSNDSNNSDYYSGSNRDILLNILGQSNFDNLNISSQSNGSLEDELQFDRTEDNIHISHTNLRPGVENQNYVSRAISKPNSGFKRNSTETLKRTNSQILPTMINTAQTFVNGITDSDEDGQTCSKYSRNTHSPLYSSNSNNPEDEVPENDNSDETYTVKSESSENSNANDENQTIYMTPQAGKGSSRPITNKLEYRRRLIRSASSKKVKVDLSRLDKRPHNIILKKNFKPLTCIPCGKSINFCTKCAICMDCRTVAHIACQPNLSLPCIPHFTPRNNARNRSQLLAIGDFTALDTRPFVPSILVHCCNEIEKRGLNEVGLYRKCGSDRDIRELKLKFLTSKTGAPCISKVDIHVLCGVVKMFLRDLDDPLITRVLWHDFVRASDVEAHGEVKSMELLKRSIDLLPDPNRDSLAFLICHLKRISDYSDTIKMSLMSLAKIFGPTIIGHSTSQPLANVITENQKQIQTMKALLSLPIDYWQNTLLEPEIFKTPTGINNVAHRKTARTTGHKAMNATSPFSYISASSSIYNTPANVRVTRFSPISPRNLFSDVDPII